jgi:membrane protein DedA with SNARE-associated domain
MEIADRNDVAGDRAGCSGVRVNEMTRETLPSAAESLDTGSETAPPPVPLTPAWLESRGIPRWLIVVAYLLLVALAIAAIAVPYAFDWFDEGSMRSLGYAGIFLMNFLPHVTLFFPLPGLAAVGHALIIAGADSLNPVLVVAIATTAMTLAEFTSYWAGMLGRAAADRRQKPMPGRLGEWVRRAASWVDWLMARAGFATLFILSALPNPVFEFAGITAGAVRMNIVKFTIAVAAGHLVRVTALVIAGEELIDAVF